MLHMDCWYTDVPPCVAGTHTVMHNNCCAVDTIPVQVVLRVSIQDRFLAWVPN